VTIGDVYVTDLECINPYKYRGEWWTGESRRAALAAFRDGGDTTGMQLWHARCPAALAASRRPRWTVGARSLESRHE